jgi:hypothetical protein
MARDVDPAGRSFAAVGDPPFWDPRTVFCGLAHRFLPEHWSPS